MPELTHAPDPSFCSLEDSSWEEFGEGLMPELSDDEYARYLLSHTTHDL